MSNAGKRVSRFARAVLSFVLTASLASCMGGCRPTDFFTEVVISPYADVVDEDNPEQTVVNSPDANEESKQLASLDWTDESTQSSEVNNLAVYSSEPNSDLTTHHSVFDPYPLLPGVEASDGVRLEYEEDAETDHEAEDADADDEQTEDSESASAGGSQVSEEILQELQFHQQQAQERAQQESQSSSVTGAVTDESEEQSDSTDGEVQSDSATGEVSQNSTAAAAQGSSGSDVDITGGGSSDATDSDPAITGSKMEKENENGATDNNPNEGGELTSDPETKDRDNPDDSNVDDGIPTDDEVKGAGGDLTVLTSRNEIRNPPNVDSVGVIGLNVAVLVEAIGGPGSICAMAEGTYWGTADEQASSLRTFAEVFGEAAFYGDENSDGYTLWWSGDGTKQGDVKDIEELVRAVGRGGLIYYDQNLVSDPNDLFTEEERKWLTAWTGEDAITFMPLDTTSYENLTQSATSVGRALKNSEVLKANGWTKENGYGSLHMAETYNETLAGIFKAVEKASAKNAEITAFIATGSETGLRFVGDETVDASRIVLFSGGASSLYYECFEKSGIKVGDQSAVGDKSHKIRPLWPLAHVGNVEPFLSRGSASGTYYSRWSGANGDLNTMNASSVLGLSHLVGKYGLGSEYAPYLVVCASDGKSAYEVKQSTVESITSFSESRVITPYSFYPNAGTNMPASATGALGERLGNAFSEKDGVTPDEAVRENPSGLLCDWTEGSFEGILEAVWVADVYSGDTAIYTDPSVDMSKYRLVVDNEVVADGSNGGDQAVCDTICWFYSRFYRCNLTTEEYNAIVPDKGL